CRKKNQMIRQVTEEHDRKIYEANHEQLRSGWNNPWPHICLSHETHELDERNCTKKARDRYSVDLRLKSPRLSAYFVDHFTERPTPQISLHCFSPLQRGTADTETTRGLRLGRRR